MEARNTRNSGSDGYTASAQELERGERFLSAYNVIEQAMQRMTQDPAGKDGFRRNVVTFRDSAPMRDVLSALDRTGYLQFPIYRDGRYIGLLTGAGRAPWVASEEIAGGRSSLLAPLITKSGSPSVKLLGIVTPSDMLTMDY